MRSIVKRGSAIALAVILVLPGISLLKAHANNGIDTTKEGNLTITVEGNTYADELNEMEIPVSIYKVADVSVDRIYTSVDAFTEMDFSTIDSDTTAADWLVLAEQATGYTDGATAVAEAVVKAEGTSAAKAVIDNLPVGLYLIVPEDVYTSDYTYKYTFTPYFTALPSYVPETGWNYDPEVGFKVGLEEQYGKLHITKNLTDYNVSLGKVTFVFLVEGVNATGQTVYSNVVTTTHSEAGSETVTLENIPANATVTVTEVYSGASYTVSGDSVKSDIIIYSEKAVEEGATEASVSFANNYDGGLKGGYGVTNHFESDGNGGWTWENPTQSAN